jgi:predicted signal transduction protein with EAL and GGDEF domain
VIFNVSFHWEKQMPNSKMSEGSLRLFYSIKSRFPHLEDSVVNEVCDVVLDEVAKRIGSGDSLAFFRLDGDGRAEVITYALEQIKKG